MRKRSFLDEALHQATLKEQERIIKLLEEIAETDKYRAIWELIIAIKGEQK